MDILDHPVNKRIMSGSFPSVHLLPASCDSELEIDFVEQAKEGLAVMNQSPGLFNIFFIHFRKEIQELGRLNLLDYCNQGVNSFINSRFNGDLLMVTGSRQEAYSLNPVVTPLDKVLWFGAHACFTDLELNADASAPESKTMMFAWIHLLSLAQNMELKTGRTIKVEAVKPETRLIDIISGTYEEKGFRSCVRRVTPKEATALKQLFAQRESLVSKINEERKIAKEIAQKTEKEWSIFLRIINDLSAKEHRTIDAILNVGSAKDKIRAIQEYNHTIDEIERFRYTLGTKTINLVPVMEAVVERIQKASTYASAQTDNGRAFRVHPAIFALAAEPQTYNSYFIAFHHFRLAPGKETAKVFLSLALSCIKRNLGGEILASASLNDMIEDFHSTVVQFMNENRHAVERLSFDRLLGNTVVVKGFGVGEFEASELHRSALAKELEEYISSGTYDRDIDHLIQGKSKTLSAEELMAQVEGIKAKETEFENEATARRIIISLNIIYLFCDALRIMLSNKHCNIELNNREKIVRIRRELLTLDDKLVHTVYAHLGDQEVGMLEYREKNGVFSFTLSEQEAQEETFRNMTFSTILKDSIEGLVERIESQSSDQIMSINTQIRAEVMRYPDCDQKDYYASWLDSISGRIGLALIGNCKKQKDDYQSVKQNLLSFLGSKCGILPQSTVDSLTTAEILFSRYASEDFADAGFDFSCISALYYQAFEDAYNDLIWRGYADKLNALVINGTKYTDILEASRKGRITDSDAMGYLDDQNSYQRGYYVKYKGKNNPQTYVNHRCMYMSFGILMENICNPSNLNGFCEHFAKLAGFSGKEEMFKDQTFMQKCTDFTSDIKQSANNRNNASHGGSFISLSQCADDKRIVLNNLELVRSTSIGLIQQLLYILQKD